jgi:DNA polymerase III sliding clamp (beta) subunit (PCNA family)
MAQAKTEPTIETIADVKLWEALCDAANALAFGEGVLEFDDDRLRLRVKDPANVALVDQKIPADAFEHYDVEAEHSIGLNFEKLDDLLSVVDTDTIAFGWDWDAYAWSFEADGVDATIGGIDPDSVEGSPVDVPPVKDKYDYNVDVTLPVHRFKKASKVVDMASDQMTFRMGGDDATFEMSAEGDTDTYSITAHDADGFEWRDDAPDTIEQTNQSNKYVKEIVSLLDEDTVRFVNGGNLPYHLWTTRAGCIETKVMQAPRVTSE